MAFFSLQIGQYAAQVLVHSALAVLIVEALLKLWRIEAPRIRVHFRILFLVLPLVGWPVFQLLWPTRGSLEFRGTLAIFDIQQWLPLRVAGVPGWAPRCSSAAPCCPPDTATWPVEAASPLLWPGLSRAGCAGA